MMPDSLDTLMQRGGRGGRDGINLCKCTLFVEDGAAERLEKKISKSSANTSSNRDDDGSGEEELEQEGLNGEDEDCFVDTSAINEDQFGVLVLFITTDSCLWQVIDKYYGNPEHEGQL
jgi:hypothetical protein